MRGSDERRADSDNMHYASISAQHPAIGISDTCASHKRWRRFDRWLAAQIAHPTHDVPCTGTSVMGQQEMVAIGSSGFSSLQDVDTSSGSARQSTVWIEEILWANVSTLAAPAVNQRTRCSFKMGGGVGGDGYYLATIPTKEMSTCDCFLKM